MEVVERGKLLDGDMRWIDASVAERTRDDVDQSAAAVVGGDSAFGVIVSHARSPFSPCAEAECTTRGAWNAEAWD